MPRNVEEMEFWFVMCGDKGQNGNYLPEIQLSLASVQVDPGAGPADHQSGTRKAFSNCGYSGIDCATCIHDY